MQKATKNWVRKTSLCISIFQVPTPLLGKRDYIVLVAIADPTPAAICVRFFVAKMDLKVTFSHCFLLQDFKKKINQNAQSTATPRLTRFFGGKNYRLKKHSIERGIQGKCIFQTQFDHFHTQNSSLRMKLQHLKKLYSDYIAKNQHCIIFLYFLKPH